MAAVFHGKRQVTSGRVDIGHQMHSEIKCGML